MRFLGATPGRNLDYAIRCYKFHLTHDRPFTAHDIGISGQTIKLLSEKGIIKLIANEKKRYPNEYKITIDTIEILEKRFSEML